MNEWLSALAQFVKELGFPVVVALWLMYFVNKVLVINEIVQALIRIDEKIERLLLLERGENDAE